MAFPRPVPTAFTAGRVVTLEGVTYAAGQTVPNAVVARVKAMSALISRGILKPNTVVRGQRRLSVRLTRPVSYGVRERAKIASTP